MDSSDFEFFAVLLQPPSEKLRLAEKFAKWSEGREPREVKLREAGDVSGRLWDVEVLFDRVGQMYFGHGWNQFAKHYNLEEGHFLVFIYDCNNVLTMKVFGPTMCRMYYQHDDAIPESVLDQFCVFSKGPNLTESQKTVLKNFCAQNQPNPPLYICSIVKSHIVDGKGQMYFSCDYTKNYLESQLALEGSDVKVYYNNNQKMAEVHMKVGKKKKATMTGKWLTVTEDQKWEVGDIIMFWVQNHGDNSLQVRVEKI